MRAPCTFRFYCVLSSTNTHLSFVIYLYTLRKSIDVLIFVAYVTNTAIQAEYAHDDTLRIFKRYIDRNFKTRMYLKGLLHLGDTGLLS